MSLSKGSFESATGEHVVELASNIQMQGHATCIFISVLCIYIYIDMSTCACAATARQKSIVEVICFQQRGNMCFPAAASNKRGCEYPHEKPQVREQNVPGMQPGQPNQQTATRTLTKARTERSKWRKARTTATGQNCRNGQNGSVGDHTYASVPKTETTSWMA